MDLSSAKPIATSDSSAELIFFKFVERIPVGFLSNFFHCSPWSRMPSAFEDVREATGWVRPSGKHGCAAAEVFPGIWTAHYHDVDTLKKLNSVA